MSGDPSRSRLLAELRIDSDSIKRLEIYENLLQRWSAIKNLVAASTLKDVWIRHFIDSAQVQRAVPQAKVWADLGSGAGFPGLITAILLADVPNTHVHLIEADHRKCAFLRAVSRETGCRTTVHSERIEDVVGTLVGVEAVSARAVASLAQLVSWSAPLLSIGAIGVFPKGKRVHGELTELSTDSSFTATLGTSVSPGGGYLVLVRRRICPKIGVST
ncbi:MAG: methyltransferase GidB [Hyphomicrobiales bacterium]|nr:methyltransferase GidB [Hyphomicrobiales bacterium]